MKHITAVALIAICICLLFLSSTSVRQLHAQGTLSPTALGTLAATVDVLPQYSQTLTYDQVLTLYGNISTQVAKTSQDTIDLAKWILLTVITVIIAAGGLIVYIASSVTAARASSKRSADAAQKSQERIESLERVIQESLSELTIAKKQATLLRKQLERLQTGNLVQLETLAYINIYSIKLFSEKAMDRQIASSTLIEYSRDENPVIRRECARVLGTISKSSGFDTTGVEARLREMALGDTELAVIAEAKNSLTNLEGNQRK